MLLLAHSLGDAFDIIVICPSTDASANLLRRAPRLGVKVFPAEPQPHAVERWLHILQPDLVHVHAGIGWEGHALTSTVYAAGILLLRTEHLPDLITDASQRAHHAESLGLVERVVVVSEASARTYAEAGIPAEKLCTIRNGIEPRAALRSRAETRLGLGIAPGDILLLSVARFAPQKGHSILLHAFDLVRRDVPQAKLVLVGSGPEWDAVENLATKLRLDGHVTFLGKRDDVPDLLSAADLFVLPSLFEGLPLALLEAMAAGVPIVATSVGGTLEAIGDTHPFLCDAGDSAALAAAMLDAMRKPELRQSAVRAARTRFDAEFHAARMASETAGLYIDTLESKQGKGRPRMKRTRIGMVGAGGIAARHLGVLEQFGDVELAAFSDVDFERAAAAAQRFGARAFEDHRLMLAAGGLDAVYICVPPFAHGGIESDLVEAGLPFFVEKPLSLDIGTAETIARKVARAGLVTAVGYHWRYLDTVEEARRLLADNPARLVSGYWLDATPPPQWWWKGDRSGGQMIEQTTHIFDLARYLVGDVATVFGQAQHSDRPDFPGLDVATASTASLKFVSGAVGNVASTCLLRWGHRVGLHLFADGLAIELTDHDIMVDTGHGRPVRRAEGDPVWREDRDFVDAVRGGENRIRCPYGEALETHRLALAASASAISGKVIDLARPRLAPVRETAHA